MSSQNQLDPNDEFVNEWMNQQAKTTPPGEKKSSPVRQNFEQIKDFAYTAFDMLDKDGNGFIETSELYEAMNDEATPMREKSYIMFLLTNQADIAASAYEGSDEHKDAISRADLELYFRLILSRIK